jgi:FkbM family methyltransferase
MGGCGDYEGRTLTRVARAQETGKERVGIRSHIRSGILSVDRQLGLRAWLRGSDVPNGDAPRPVDPFTSTSELRHPRPNTVIDIGGNAGQFAEEIFRVFPGATVYSFEPLPDCYERLVALSAREPSLHTFQLALSDRAGEAEFFVSRFRDSSSIQEMLPSHLDAWPHTDIETRITVPVEPLDVVAQRLELVPPVFTKLDVQGHEMSVIAGGRETLARCQRVMLECNFAPLYRGQPSFVELYDALRSLGFLFDGFISPLRHPRTRELLSADAVFFKPQVDGASQSPRADSEEPA